MNHLKHFTVSIVYTSLPRNILETLIINRLRSSQDSKRYEKLQRITPYKPLLKTEAVSCNRFFLRLVLHKTRFSIDKDIFRSFVCLSSDPLSVFFSGRYVCVQRQKTVVWSKRRRYWRSSIFRWCHQCLLQSHHCCLNFGSKSLWFVFIH